MPRELFVLRTNFFSDYCEELLKKLSEAGKEVVVCADESKGEIDTKSFPKIRMGLKSIDRLGIYRHKKSAWLCGDYFLYHVYDKRPDYDYYWLIEPDVYFDYADLSSFFDPLQACSHDYLVMHFGLRKANWAWYDTVKNYYGKVYGGPYPLVRVSNVALQYMLMKRREIPSLPA